MSSSSSGRTVYTTSNSGCSALESVAFFPSAKVSPAEDDAPFAFPADPTAAKPVIALFAIRTAARNAAKYFLPIAAPFPRTAAWFCRPLIFYNGIIKLLPPRKAIGKTCRNVLPGAIRVNKKWLIPRQTAGKNPHSLFSMYLCVRRKSRRKYPRLRALPSRRLRRSGKSRDGRPCRESR